MKKETFLCITASAVLLLTLAAGSTRAQGPAPHGGSVSQAALGPAFTYQGQLKKGGTLVNDTCTMVFSLFDDPAAGNLLGDPITLVVTVADGLFTVALDFGGDAFTGAARWLEIAVQCPGDAGFSPLTPRQALTAAPYALSLLPGAVISGTVAGASGLLVVNSAADGITFGVTGRADATSGLNGGVYGQSYSTDGRGVIGWAGAASGVTYGVFGQSTSPLGDGVYGIASASSGSAWGVEGRSYSTDGRGVYGYSDAASGHTYGVYGAARSTNGTGVYGLASATSGVNYGVYGQSASTAGAGVYGYATASSGYNCGVLGGSYSTAGYGVYSEGNFGATGSKSAIVDTADYGWRKLYSMESPDIWFEDVGTAQLTEGAARVAIDPVFAETVNLQEQYHVFLTPLGDCALYVAEKTTAGFTVRALGGQACSIAFDYRIIAKRLGYEKARLTPAEDPALAVPAASQAREEKP